MSFLSKLFKRKVNEVQPLTYKGAYTFAKKVLGKFDLGIIWRAFKRYLYYKFIYKDTIYNTRGRFYPEMLRWHKDRIEFRFIPNYTDSIMKEVVYILGDD